MAIAITATDNNSDPVDRGTYTNTVNLGSGSPGDAFILKVGARNATGITSVKLAGVAATSINVASRTDTGSNVAGQYVIAAASLPDPSAASGSLETIFNTTASRYAFAVERMSGHASLTPADFVKAEVAANGVAGPVDVPLPLDVPEGGAISAVACAADNNTAGTSFAWTNLTERTDFQTTGENFRMSTAFDVGLSAESNRAVNARFTGSAGIFSPVGVAASFTPAADEEIEEGEGTAAGTSTVSGQARALAKRSASAAGAAVVAGLAKALAKVAAAASGAATVSAAAKALMQRTGTAAGEAGVSGVAQAVVTAGNGEHPLLVAEGIDLRRGDTVSAADPLGQAERMTDQGPAIVRNTNLFG